MKEREREREREGTEAMEASLIHEIHNKSNRFLIWFGSFLRSKISKQSPSPKRKEYCLGTRQRGRQGEDVDGGAAELGEVGRGGGGGGGGAEAEL